MHPNDPNSPEPATSAACLAALICENAVLARQLAAAQARCPAPAPAATPGYPAAPTPDDRPRRRKLHELPAHAQDLLLALSFAPATLRAEIEKALSRMRGQPVQLLGSDADVLYSAMHDMGQRHALSAALHRRLEARHTVAVRRLASLHDVDDLRQAWQDTLQQATRPHEEIPAMLWALLTHRLGATQEVRALAEARSWVFAQARRGQAAADLAAARQLQEAQAEVRRLQLRLQQAQAAHAQELQAARCQAATLVGEARRCQALTQPSSQPAALPRPRPAGHVRLPQGPAVPSTTLVSPISQVGPITGSTSPSPPGAAAASTATAPGHAAGDSPVQGRRVLCVGGIQHAVARYRSRIETLGGRFEHHDGGIHDNAHALDGRLARADLVICQAGCINHAAYHRIKQHCQRTGTPCLYLERASLSRFDRALQGLQGTASRPGENRPA